MTTTWASAPSRFEIGAREVHVWRALLDNPDWSTERYARLLNAEEHARAGRFRFERDRERFAAGRGLARTLLSHYCDLDAAAIAFDFSEHGKPSLAAERGADEIHFNVSHSGSVVAVAVSTAAPVGVDVESVDRRVEVERLAERFFSPDEVDRLRAIPDADRRDAFFECWTRKEAFIKAHGHGLTLPLDSFSVRFGPGTTAQLTRFEGEPGIEHWTLSAPDVADGYASAVCLAAPDGTFRHFDASSIDARL